MQFEQTTLQASLEKVLRAKAFENSATHQNLLQFLFDASLKGEAPREAEIAKMVFGRDKDFNANDDPIVRVYMHKLRKKLDKYYQHEGRCDKIKLDIPKGQYKVEFAPQTRSTIESFRIKSVIKYVVNFLFPLLLIGLLIWFWHDRQELSHQIRKIQKISHDNPFWSGYIQSEKNTLVVLGDLFFYTMQHEGLQREVVVRDYEINTLEEFEALKTQHPDFALDYRKLRHAYFDKSNVWPLPAIFSMLMPHSVKFDLRLASKLNPEDIKENNIIFLGNLKTSGLFQHYLRFSTIDFGLSPNELRYQPEADSVPKVVHPQGSIYQFHTDYAVVVRVPGPDNNEIMIFGDFLATGNYGASEYLTSPADLARLQQRFIKKYGKVPRYFELVFKIDGFNRTAFSTEIIHLQAIED